ncbi:MAG: NADH-quinone oxidoreductase subunit NuoG [Casimicrobiaceae bacterium]|nr:NADH-quinone oxidoreductase subunit NuoG [Casimicrobiaceae bacterium]MDW8311320.1 NADH-quinone oxidoreductase subunit NuoG [Burkholderiales bacterium]
MITIEIDGKSIQVPPGSTVMDAARQIGAYIPHFCYHPKLSIAANCRMCLVQVEKAPKPLPACATPVTEGMKVYTASEYAKQAQRAVMEFLLINHPLDCPICDQGGECQLQDLAVGYGKSASRYQEEKRVVFVKNLGPLISAEEMSRCIHCTRCVRFGQEIAGQMELGMAGRGEHSEILAFVGQSVDHELSGNMIDVCPVGALTSKPFRYSARTWELQRRRSVSPHDGLGANIQVQVKHDRVMRVLPLENEALNECWISDRDRFSYEGLYAADRLTQPMLRLGEDWQAVSWSDALAAAAEALKSAAKTELGGQGLAMLLGPHTTVEEAYLARQLAAALGSSSIDARLRVTDPAMKHEPAVDLGFKVGAIAQVDRFLVVGSSLREEQPLLASRIRQRIKRGATLCVVSTTDEDLLCPVAAKCIVAPSKLAQTLQAVAEAVERRARQEAAPAGSDPAVEALAAELLTGKRVAVILGDLAQSNPQAAAIRAAARRIAQATGGSWGEAQLSASVLGAALVGAVPGPTGKSAGEALTTGAAGFLLVGVEPELDSAFGAEALAALSRAQQVVALTTYAGETLRRHCHVMLPLSPFTETSGTWVAQDGTVQSFQGVVRPLGETRPGWKILRVLAELCGASVSGLDTPEAVRSAALPKDVPSALAALRESAARGGTSSTVTVAVSGFERIADVPIYAADPIVRRAASLQATRYARRASVRLHPETATRAGLAQGQPIRVRAGARAVEAVLGLDATVPRGCVRIPCATAVSAALGSEREISIEAIA